jgi:drug/metabolite transporter (DMT)-like permease
MTRWDAMTWLTLLLAFVGNSVLNISQAGQKLGLALMRRDRRRGALLWIGSLLGTTVAALIGWLAVTIGRVALVGAMAGSGLASLAVFSFLVMKERIRALELAGILVMAGSAALIGLFQRELPLAEPSLRRLFLYLAVLCAASLLGWFALRRRSRAVGPVIAGFAGVLGGFVPLLQKVASSAAGRGTSFLVRFLPETHRAHAVVNLYTLLWVLISMVSMAVIQFAYRHERAVRLIPYFTSCSILVPVFGAVLVFQERLAPAQWAGIALILTGLLLLTAPAARRSGRDSP